MFQEYSDAAISDAAERAGLKEFIARQEYGMETRIRESGNNLSGGEKQRIAVTRALPVSYTHLTLPTKIAV